MNTLENPTVSLADGYYRDVFEHAPDGMYSINANGVIVECNETWANMLGSTKADIIGRRSVDLLTPASKEKAATLLPIFFREGEMHDVAFQYVRGDGSVLGAELSATLHDDPSTGRRFSRAIVRAVPEEVPPAFGRMDRESSEPKLSTVILAIEDPALREVCRQRLRTEGHAVVALDRTLALLTLPRTLNYDLVCVDGSAFGTDVLKVLDERRQGRVPVVGIGVEREGLAASLPLPLDGERLRITIEEIVRRKAGGSDRRPCSWTRRTGPLSPTAARWRLRARSIGSSPTCYSIAPRRCRCRSCWTRSGASRKGGAPPCWCRPTYATCA